jgi:hypothetical protein
MNPLTTLCLLMRDELADTLESLRIVHRTATVGIYVRAKRIEHLEGLLERVNHELGKEAVNVESDTQRG